LSHGGVVALLLVVATGLVLGSLLPEYRLNVLKRRIRALSRMVRYVLDDTVWHLHDRRGPPLILDQKWYPTAPPTLQGPG